jgi:hypothetical protein
MSFFMGYSFRASFDWPVGGGENSTVANLLSEYHKIEPAPLPRKESRHDQL